MKDSHYIPNFLTFFVKSNSNVRKLYYFLRKKSVYNSAYIQEQHEMQNRKYACVSETHAYIACRSSLQIKLQFTTNVLNKTSNNYASICRTYVSFSVHFLNFLSLDLFLPTHCSCKRLLLHLITQLHRHSQHDSSRDLYMSTLT